MGREVHGLRTPSGKSRPPSGSPRTVTTDLGVTGPYPNQGPGPGAGARPRGEPRSGRRPPVRLAHPRCGCRTRRAPLTAAWWVVLSTDAAAESSPRAAGRSRVRCRKSCQAAAALTHGPLIRAFSVSGVNRMPRPNEGPGQWSENRRDGPACRRSYGKAALQPGCRRDIAAIVQQFNRFVPARGAPAVQEAGRVNSQPFRPPCNL